MAVSQKEQLGIDERVLDDPELERALEEREKAKAGKNEAARTFNTKDEVVKNRLEELDIEVDEPVRIGRYVCSRTKVAAKSVAFDTAETTRLAITPKDPDD
jgi:hypothetical protein